MSEFKKRVLQIVNAIPYGTVMSYGQIASYAGAPRGARQVGWILNQCEGKVSVPWWRVVNNEGRISIKGTKYYTRDLMKELLEREGVYVKKDLSFDIGEYRYVATVDELLEWKLPEKYIDRINAKYLRFTK